MSQVFFSATYDGTLDGVRAASVSFTLPHGLSLGRDAVETMVECFRQTLEEEVRPLQEAAQKRLAQALAESKATGWHLSEALHAEAIGAGLVTTTGQAGGND